MSRIGQKPIDIPGGVTVAMAGATVSVKGPKGELTHEVPPAIDVKVEDDNVIVSRADDTKMSKSLHGLSRSLVANMVEGVSRGFSKRLEIQGVGFRAAAQGQELVLTVGRSSPVQYVAPQGVVVTVEDGGTTIVVAGPDKQKVGEAAARIRAFAPAEPYKGKGVRYKGEHVRRKVGKTVA